MWTLIEVAIFSCIIGIFIPSTRSFSIEYSVHLRKIESFSQLQHLLSRLAIFDFCEYTLALLLTLPFLLITPITLSLVASFYFFIMLIFYLRHESRIDYEGIDYTPTVSPKEFLRVLLYLGAFFSTQLFPTSLLSYGISFLSGGIGVALFFIGLHYYLRKTMERVYIKQLEFLFKFGALVLGIFCFYGILQLYI